MVLPRLCGLYFLRATLPPAVYLRFTPVGLTVARVSRGTAHTAATWHRVYRVSFALSPYCVFYSRSASVRGARRLLRLPLIACCHVSLRFHAPSGSAARHLCMYQHAFSPRCLFILPVPGYCARMRRTHHGFTRSFGFACYSAPFCA